VTSSDRRVETIGQVHPLISFVTNNLRSEEHGKGASVSAAQVHALGVPGVEPGTYAFAVQRWSFSGQRDVERLMYEATRLAEDECCMNGDTAERLVNGVSLYGTEWLNAAGEVDGAAAHRAVHACVERLEQRFAAFVKDMVLENEDRIGLQLQVLERHEVGRRIQLAERIERMRQERKLKGAQMYAAQLRKHDARCADRRAVLERKRGTTHEARLVALGLVRVR
jgi:hypothetical protein